MSDDNCFVRCLGCLSSVPGPSLTACVMMIVAVSACAASFMIGTSRAQVLLDNDKLMPHYDTICLSVIFGMLLLGIFFVIIAVMSSGSNAKKLFNTPGKNMCARVLNVMILVLMYTLLLAWLVVSAMLALPLVLFGIIHILHKEWDVNCINLKDYAIFRSKKEFCGADLDQFYNDSQDVFLCYVISYIGSLLTVLSLTLFILFAGANFLHLKNSKKSEYIYKNHDARTSNNSVHDTRM